MSERQVTPTAAQTGAVHTPEGETGTTRALPDDHLLVTLADGRSFVVEGDQLALRHDGTYLLMPAPDRRSPPERSGR